MACVYDIDTSCPRPLLIAGVRTGHMSLGCGGMHKCINTIMEG